MEFKTRYDDVSGDPSKNNLLVATLTLAQSVSKEGAATLTFVNANKPEYRGEVDKELSARVGFEFTMDKKQ